jgi:hypothetical protein
MRDQYELAQECLNVEKGGGDPIEYLKSLGYISAKATWERLQMNELGRHNEKKFKEIKTMRKKITREQKEKAVQIYIDGGDPKEYLKSIGIPNPVQTWCSIKAYIKKAKPEIYRKFPDGTKDTAEAEPVETQKVPEKPKITKPVNYDGFSVRAVEGKFGSYHFQEINGKQWIDYENREGADELSMTVDQWRGFLAEIREAARVLGVEL